jgi:siroheme synthase-like protein
VAVNERDASEQIARVVKENGKLMNVADKPDLCDFYLGGVVTKGNLKIAISTNGKSPTIAKRLKEFLYDALPDSVDDLLENMQQIRNSLKGNLFDKINKLNEITRSMISKEKEK